MEPTQITLAHSPDADDAFMFYALSQGLIETNGLRFEHVLKDIESLNQAARKGVYDVTAISIHAYPHLASTYALLNCGGSVGDGYGPILVARRPLNQEELSQSEVAVPGILTTAYLVFRLFAPEAPCRVLHFDRILDAVTSGAVDAGLLIHEGQLSYADEDLTKVCDLGAWWGERTGLPLPLGGNVIRRDLGEARIGQVSGLIRDTIQYALNHKREALEYAMQYARGLPMRDAERFIGMYVNEYSLDYGERGRTAIEALLREGQEASLIPQQVDVDFVP